MGQLRAEAAAVRVVLVVLALVAEVGSVGHWWRVGEEVVDFAGDVAFEAADGVAAGFAFAAAARGVGLGAFVAAQADHGDAPEGLVGVAVAAAVEAVADGLPGGGCDGAGAAEGGEAGVAGEALGVVAGGDEERGGGVGSDAVGGEQGGIGGGAQGAEFAVEGGGLGGERLVASCEAAQRRLGGGEQRIGGGGGAQAGAGVDEGAAAVAAELVFERFVGGDEQVVDLVVRAGAGLGRGAPRHGEHADRLDGAGAGFGHSCGVAGEGGARRGFGVGGVGLAAPAAGLAVGAVHLPHAHTRRCEVAGEAGAVAAGAFDADAAQRAQRRQPGGQFAVTGARRRERRRPQQRPRGVNSGGDMDITVRVHPTDDFSAVLGHNGAALLGQPTDTGHHRPGRRTGHSGWSTQGS